MTTESRRNAGPVIALLATALVTGAMAGAVAACFIWLVEAGTKWLWTDVPHQLGIDAFNSWWMFAIPVAGGALVGVGQRVLGNYPEPIETSVATWRSGGRLEPIVAPKTAVNSLIALITGGPVGFEAALTGLLGGMASWISDRIGAVGTLVRQAWGAERIDSLATPLRKLPYWLAAGAGLFTFRWLPFGQIDSGFRFSQFNGGLGVIEGLAVFVFAAVMAVPVAWAIVAIGRAEKATVFQRSPILIGMAGGLVFAILAVPNDLVLFSGQQGIQALPGTGTAQLAYVALIKVLALIIALYAGWRGGPVFPTFTSAAAVGVLAASALGLSPQLMMVAGITAVSVVFAKGSLPLAFLITLYPVPLSFTAVIIIGCLGGAVGLAIGRSLRALPSPAADTGDTGTEAGVSDTSRPDQR